MRVLVTGVLGFAGRYVATAARVRGHEVVGSGLERAPDPERRADLADYRPCDVTELEAVDALLAWAEPEAVLHLAGQASGGRAFADPVPTFRVNADGVLHLLEAARRRGFGGPILVVTSSEAYGRIPLGRPVDESSPLRPVSPYGTSKAAADQLAQLYARAYDLHVVRARSFSHTGPGQDTAFVTSSWVEQAARAEQRAEAGEKGPFEIRVGNLDPVRDVSDVRDVAEAYLDLIERGGRGEAYNVCTGHGVKLRDLLTRIQERARAPVSIVNDPERMRAADIPYLVGSTKKIGKEIGWRTERSLDETVEALLEDWRARLRDARPAERRA